MWIIAPNAAVFFLWLLIWCSVYSCIAAELTKDFNAKEKDKREKGLGITDRIFVIIYIKKRTQ